MRNKVMNMNEAIDLFVHDGDTVYIGGFVQHEPYAAIHEIIRQKKRNLTISTAAATIFADLLIGAGCVKRIIASYIWNPLPANAHAFRRAVEKGIPNQIEVEEYSLFALNLAYFAGAMRLPFVATKTLLGTDFINQRGFMGEGKLKVIESPFNGEKVCLIPPIRHDVGIVQLQRADSHGNAQAWGLLGPTRFGLYSCDKIIVCVEEIVDSEIIQRDPNRTIVPSFRVNAVVEEPWGAYPSYIQGYYNRDWRFIASYARETETLEGFQRYLKEWIYDVKNRKEYCEKVGKERLQSLKGKDQFSTPVNYGFYDQFI
jgi:glutaconate CoA-transferase subunit A